MQCGFTTKTSLCPTISPLALFWPMALLRRSSSCLQSLHFFFPPQASYDKPVVA